MHIINTLNNIPPLFLPPQKLSLPEKKSNYPRIIFCLPGRSFSGAFLKCWTELYAELVARGFNPMFVQKYTSNVYYVRSMCLGADVRRGVHQKPFDGKVDYDYLMWIDSDIIFTPNDFFRLLNHRKDIVGGLYLMENGLQFPVVEKWDEEYFQKNGTFQFMEKDEVANKKGIFEVAYNGFGFLLIKKGVFEKIPYPWFAPKMLKIGNCEDFPSEDVSFCLRARDAGFKIYTDPNVIVGHEKLIPIGMSTVL
jgi:GT2 family glycosyltransferase